MSAMCPTCGQMCMVSAPLPAPQVPYGWASEWTGRDGKLHHAFHGTEAEAHDNAEWMHGRAFPLFAAPPAGVGGQELGPRPQDAVVPTEGQGAAVVVPKEPTEAMLRAGWSVSSHDIGDGELALIYAAMIAAAPSPKTGEGS